MAIWWKRLLKRGGRVEHEAAQFLAAHGSQASEVARKAARIARNKKDHRQARHFSHIALHISELSSRDFGLDPTSRISAMSKVAEPSGGGDQNTR